MAELRRKIDPKYIEPEQYLGDIAVAVAQVNGRFGLIGPIELPKIVVSEKKLAARQKAQRTDHGDKGQNRNDVWVNTPKQGRILVPRGFRELPRPQIDKLMGHKDD